MADQVGVSGLAQELGVSERHLRRELQSTIGTSPIQLVRTRRLWVARILLDQTSLTVTEIAWAAGFGSIRQFNQSIKATFGCTPTELRRLPSPTHHSNEIALALPARGELGWNHLYSFLSSRAIDGLETAVEANEPGSPAVFRRNTSGGHLDLTGSGSTLSLRCHLADLRTVAEILPTVRAVADLDTDLEPIADHLGADPDLAPTLERIGPLRVPGAFDPFEVAIRAIVGQQVSVAGARTLLGRLLRIASPAKTQSDESGDPGEPRFERFCSPEELARADLTELGMPQARKRTITAIAQAVSNGSVRLDRHCDPGQLRRSLLAVKGIGPWTAGYIAMRAIGDPDEWPIGDLVLRRVLDLNAKDLEHRARSWSPWRAYGSMLTWNTISSPQQTPA